MDIRRSTLGKVSNRFLGIFGEIRFVQPLNRQIETRKIFHRFEIVSFEKPADNEGSPGRAAPIRLQDSAGDSQQRPIRPQNHAILSLLQIGVLEQNIAWHELRNQSAGDFAKFSGVQVGFSFRKDTPGIVEQNQETEPARGGISLVVLSKQIQVKLRRGMRYNFIGAVQRGTIETESSEGRRSLNQNVQHVSHVSVSAGLLVFNRIP
jgi:hypothetical protein